MAKKQLPILSDPRSKKIFSELCNKHGLSMSLLQDLIEIQRNNLGRGKQIGITQEFNAVIAEFIDTLKEN